MLRTKWSLTVLTTLRSMAKKITEHKTVYSFDVRLGFLFRFFPVLMIFLQACSPKPLYDDTKKVTGSVWNAGEKIQFEVPVDDTVNIYQFFLSLRHSTDYRYANVFFFINTTFPDGKTARDTVECILADRQGKWLGSGITNVRDMQVMLRRGLRFPQEGTYIFDFEQAMREPELKGIKDIGLRIVKED